MKERFGKDSVIALATEENGIPYVRYVNAYYMNVRAVRDALIKRNVSTGTTAGRRWRSGTNG
jgi:hypothetical protein